MDRPSPRTARAGGPPPRGGSPPPRGGSPPPRRGSSSGAAAGPAAAGDAPSRRNRSTGGAAGSAGAGGQPAGAAASGGAAGFWMVLGFIAVLTVAGWGIASWRTHQPDLHFLAAKKILRDYELGKEPSALNYDDPTYTGALAELALVSPSSVSAEPAHALATEISGRLARFREGLKVRQAQIDEAAKANESRTAIFAASQEATTGTDIWAAKRLSLRAVTECKEESEAQAKPDRGGRKPR